MNIKKLSPRFQLAIKYDAILQRYARFFLVNKARADRAALLVLQDVLEKIEPVDNAELRFQLATATKVCCWQINYLDLQIQLFKPPQPVCSN